MAHFIFATVNPQVTEVMHQLTEAIDQGTEWAFDVCIRLMGMAAYYVFLAKLMGGK